MAKTVRSLRARLLLVAGLVLVFFTALALAVLDNAFRNNNEIALQDSLQAQLYALLTIVEPAPDGALNFVESLAEPRYGVADSGLYAFIYDRQGRNIWHSASAVGVIPPDTISLKTGERNFGRETSTQRQDFYVSRFGVAWDIGTDSNPEYTFVVMESAERHDELLRRVRQDLFWWSAAGTTVLLALLVFSLRWAMSPLRQVSVEIQEIEQGRQTRVTGEYPREIAGLTNNLNGLIVSGQRSLERYRNSLGDLAHSLKTPLAVIRGAAGDPAGNADFRQCVGEQVDRMQTIVDFQLRKAASSGGSVLVKPLKVEPVVLKIVRALEKVHRDRDIRSQVTMDDGLSVAMDEGDFMEVLGNIIENAYKWTQSRVEITATGNKEQVQIWCDDDGPGVASKDMHSIFRRGIRADEQVPGQGIGLAVVYETVQSYGGDLNVVSNDRGGARFIVVLPGA